MFRNRTRQLRPSRGFTTVQKELTILESKAEKLPVSLRETPCFIFGPYATEDASNQPFFELLNQAQNRIRELNKKNGLVELVLEKILAYPPKISCALPIEIASLESLIQIDHKRWISILTKAMNRFDHYQDKLAFVESFKSPSERSKIHPKMMSASRKMQKGFDLARKNLQQSDAYFKNIPEDFTPVIADRLYYKILQQGSGKQIKGGGEVLVHSTLKDLNGVILSASYSRWLKLAATFQGFRHGVQGMLEGEKREIIVHPSLGYGPFTTIPPCAALVLNIELLEVANEDTSFLPPIEPIDCSLVRNTALYEDIVSSIDQLPHYRGGFYAEMYEKLKSTGKEEIVAELLHILHPISQNAG